MRNLLVIYRKTFGRFIGSNTFELNSVLFLFIEFIETTLEIHSS